MTDTIRVYVKGEQKLSAENSLVYVESGHHCSGTKSAITYKNEHVLPESQKQVIVVARKMADERGMKLHVCDLSSRMGRLRAFFAGVNETPMVIIKRQRITEGITEEKLSLILGALDKIDDSLARAK